MIPLDGKSLSQKILADLKQEISAFPSKPRLDAVIVGDNPVSLKFIELKVKAAAQVGIKSRVHRLPLTSSQQKLSDLFARLNADPEVTGFFVQLPLPEHFRRQEILENIDLSKDVDGLTSANLGRLFHGHPQAIAPAAAAGTIRLLEEYAIPLKGRHVVIVNNSPLIGQPLAALFSLRFATVSLCHEYTENLPSLTSRADILISAAGRPGLITGKYVKEGAAVIDIGSTPDAEGKLIGDIDIPSVSAKSAYLTPVPGGIGPMTVAMLIDNTRNLFIQNRA